jgi:hypothetical protein
MIRSSLACVPEKSFLIIFIYNGMNWCHTACWCWACPQSPTAARICYVWNVLLPLGIHEQSIEFTDWTHSWGSWWGTSTWMCRGCCTSCSIGRILDQSWLPPAGGGGRTAGRWRPLPLYACIGRTKCLIVPVLWRDVNLWSGNTAPLFASHGGNGTSPYLIDDRDLFVC